MEWEVGLIEWIQKTLGSLNGTIGSMLSFIGGETGLLLVLLITLFCWKKESGKRLALIIAAVNTWLPMIRKLRKETEKNDSLWSTLRYLMWKPPTGRTAG